MADLIKCMALKCLFQEPDPLNPGNCTKRAQVLIPATEACELSLCPEFHPCSVYSDIRVFQINHETIIAATTLTEALSYFKKVSLNAPPNGIYHELGLSSQIYDYDNIQKNIHRIILNSIDNGGKLPMIVWEPK